MWELLSLKLYSLFILLFQLSSTWSVKCNIDKWDQGLGSDNRNYLKVIIKHYKIVKENTLAKQCTKNFSKIRNNLIISDVILTRSSTSTSPNIQTRNYQNQQNTNNWIHWQGCTWTLEHTRVPIAMIDPHIANTNCKHTIILLKIMFVLDEYWMNLLANILNYRIKDSIS